jgi:hypothetical protein
VDLVRTDVSEQRIASIILVTLMTETIFSSETTALSRATRGHIPENSILKK